MRETGRIFDVSKLGLGVSGPACRGKAHQATHHQGSKKNQMPHETILHYLKKAKFCGLR
jgi:hypothetical protein